MRYRFLLFILFTFFGSCCGCLAVSAETVSAASSSVDLVTTTTPSVPPTSTDPLLLQMADGSFYHPKTGLKAPTREALLELIAVSSVGPVPTASSTVPVPAVPLDHEIAPTSTLEFPLWSAIKRGRAELQALIDERRKKQKIKPHYTSEAAPRDVTLAVWNTQTDHISLVDVSKDGTKIKIKHNEDGIAISVRRSNGVNSEFSAGEDRVVVAITYPILTPIKYKGRKMFEANEVVYTPDSQALHTPEMIALGQATISRFIDDAYTELRQDGVRSHALPDRLVADVIDTDLVKGIMMIEHTDQEPLAKNTAAALKPFYVIVAANQERAYAYAKSTAQALGLVQFIPKTYALYTKRADLHLIKNFEQGMRDPQNAIRAQVAYLDQALAELPAEARLSFGSNPEIVNEYLAAAYNGGVIRTKRAITTWKEAWAEPPTESVTTLKQREKTLAATVKRLAAAVKKGGTASKVQELKASLATTRQQLTATTAQRSLLEYAALRTETRVYVAKYRQVASLFTPTVLTLAQAD